MSLTAPARSIPGTLQQEVVIEREHRLITEWELGSVTVDVDYDNRSTPRKFKVVIQLGGDLNDTQLERLEKVARSCPLRKSIETGFEFVETLEREHTAGRKPVKLGVAS